MIFTFFSVSMDIFVSLPQKKKRCGTSINSSMHIMNQKFMNNKWIDIFNLTVGQTCFLHLFSAIHFCSIRKYLLIERICPLTLTRVGKIILPPPPLLVLA